MTLQLTQTKHEVKLGLFIEEAFNGKMPSLIPFVTDNSSLMKLAKHLKRVNGSPRTLFQYTFGIHRFCRWWNRTPDDLINECFDKDQQPIPRSITNHEAILDDFVGVLQDEELAPGTINNHVKGVKQLYRTNGLRVELPYKLSKKVKFKDRSPTPEELQRLIDIADLRSRTVVALLALGAFRVGTLAKLQYRHVKKDLEKGTIPIHVHVEAELTKGAYGDYDTFLGAEASEYLKLYLDSRRQGSTHKLSRSRILDGTHRIPRESIVDASPLIRDDHSKAVRSISPGRIHDIVLDLYRRAGLIQGSQKVRYELRAHSLRKYFRTQLAALSVNNDYILYMMGHTVDTYHDIQMKGVEFLRGIYAASGLSIRTKTQVSKIEMLKQVAKAWGLDPERILTKEAMAYPSATYASPIIRDRKQAQALTAALKEAVKRDIIRSV